MPSTLMWRYLRRQDPRPDKVLILVHGAGPFTFEEWLPILQAIDAQAGAQVRNYDCIGFVYADSLPPGKQDDESTKSFRAKFAQEIARERLFSRHMIAIAEQRRRGIKSKTRTTGFGSWLVDIFFALNLDNVVAWIAKHFLKVDAPVQEAMDAVHAYLSNQTAADEIRRQLGDALEEASRYKLVVLASHSLGTVVALDGLNKWQPANDKVAFWFTLGSPLSKLRRLRDDGTPNALLQSNVDEWFNLYDVDDWIADILGPEYSPQETDSAESTKPYVHDIYVNVGKDMPQVHDYYFNKPTLKLVVDSLRQESK